MIAIRDLYYIMNVVVYVGWRRVGVIIIEVDDGTDALSPKVRECMVNGECVNWSSGVDAFSFSGIRRLVCSPRQIS